MMPDVLSVNVLMCNACVCLESVIRSGFWLPYDKTCMGYFSYPVFSDFDM